MVKFLSIDPSLSCSGWATWEGSEVVDYGSIKDLWANMDQAACLLEDPFDLIVIESQFMQAGRFGGGIATVEARTIWEALAALQDIPSQRVAPTSWQSFCGLTKGLKGLSAAKRRKTIKAGSIEAASLAVGSRIESNDIADAINIGRYYLHAIEAQNEKA